MNKDRTLKSAKPVAIWLMVGVGMIIIQILLGGITRLTGSGLSITEWHLARELPLNDAQWSVAFEKYRQTEQFRQLNSGFTLGDFKFIYFWEWIHRQWGKLIGIVFLIPFVIFGIQGRFRKEMILPFVILFLLGALQAVVGWIMVASGLTGDAVYVRPTKLGMHFILALILLCYTFWFALKYLVHARDISVRPPLKKFTWLIVVVLFVQLFYGALMAGYKAAPYAPTWPTINGSMIPDQDFSSPALLERNTILTTHFIHRTLAYTLVVLVLAWTVAAFRSRGTELFNRLRVLPVAFVLIQTLLGIFTVLTSTEIKAYTWGRFEWLAQCHQITAILLLLSFVLMLFVLRRKPIALRNGSIDGIEAEVDGK